jgi:small-conductance mechanosensitive channel
MVKKFIFLLFLFFSIILYGFAQSTGNTGEIKNTSTQGNYNQITQKITPKATSSVKQAEKTPSPPAETEELKKYPVTFHGKELFYISTDLLSRKAEDRANESTTRLQNLYKNEKNLDVNLITATGEVEITGDFKGEKLTVKGINIIYDNQFIVIADEKEAELQGTTVKDLAESYVKKIREAIIIYREKTGFQSLIMGIIYSIISTIIFILLLIFSKKIFTLIIKKLDSFVADLKIQNLTIIRREQIIEILSGLINLIFFLIRVIVFYIYLTLMLSFFIWTEKYGDKLLSYVIKGFEFITGSVINYIPELCIIIITVFIAYYIIKFASFIFNALDKEIISFPGFEKDWAVPTYKIIKFILIILAIIVIYPYLPGSNTPAFKGISVFMGLIISFGSSSAVSNIISGIVLTYTNSFKIGDLVEINGKTGTVMDKSLLVTSIKTRTNEYITFPNSSVMNSSILNHYTLGKKNGLAIQGTVTIGYDTPIENVRKTLIEAAIPNENFLSEPAPFVLIKGLEDNYITYELNGWTKNPQLAQRQSELFQSMYNKCNEAGIEILSPSYYSLRDGNHCTIPVDYLPKDYISPSYKVSLLKDDTETNEKSIKIIMENCTFEERNMLIDYLKNISGMDKVNPGTFENSSAFIDTEYNKNSEELAGEIMKITSPKVEMAALKKETITIRVKK